MLPMIDGLEMQEEPKLSGCLSRERRRLDLDGIPVLDSVEPERGGGSFPIDVVRARLLRPLSHDHRAQSHLGGVFTAAPIPV